MTKAEKIAHGLIILSNYEENAVIAEYDTIIAGPPDPDTVSSEHTKSLNALGWFVSGEYESWCIFT